MGFHFQEHGGEFGVSSAAQVTAIDGELGSGLCEPLLRRGEQVHRAHALGSGYFEDRLGVGCEANAFLLPAGQVRGVGAILDRRCIDAA